ncbi:hypothetical protein BofuT4_uP154180.1 [Botrytis cinerea T4]|uniref:Uncharacterized protein n=1 Tax=Botryotinia fuckeliana (strain T4) TaxID=999810 RepID=G2YVF8_BOTF4|nr:hypothetical protein BofuT4_uP154180.1 [Botrytis cinerea T4]
MNFRDIRDFHGVVKSVTLPSIELQPSRDRLSSTSVGHGRFQRFDKESFPTAPNWILRFPNPGSCRRRIGEV